MQSTSSDNCIHRYNVEILNLFDIELQLINTKLMIKNKLKELLSELKNFKVQTILILYYKKGNDCKTFHSSAKLIACISENGEAFKSMHQSITTKIKNDASKDCIVLNVIIKHSVQILSVITRAINIIKKTNVITNL